MQPDAVIFDWGGTLTRWHDIDFHAESLALAQAVVESEHDARRHAEALHARQPGGLGPQPRPPAERHRRRPVHRGRARPRPGAARPLPRVLGAAHRHRPAGRAAVRARCATRGIKVGVLSNTIWPRAWHEDFFARDGVLDLIDGAVYTSEIPWTKPAPEAFAAAMEAVGVERPGRCVYVGDRLFDDIWGAHNAGLKAIHVPHSDDPGRAGRPHRGRARRRRPRARRHPGSARPPLTRGDVIRPGRGGNQHV